MLVLSMLLPRARFLMADASPAHEGQLRLLPEDGDRYALGALTPFEPREADLEPLLELLNQRFEVSPVSGAEQLWRIGPPR